MRESDLRLPPTSALWSFDVRCNAKHVQVPSANWQKGNTMLLPATFKC